MRQRVLDRVRELETEYGLRSDTVILKFDEQEEEVIGRLARQALVKEIRKILSSMRGRVKKFKDETEKQGNVISYTKKRLEEITTQALTFGFREELDEVIALAEKFVHQEAEAYRKRLRTDKFGWQQGELELLPETDDVSEIKA